MSLRLNLPFLTCLSSLFLPPASEGCREGNIFSLFTLAGGGGGTPSHDCGWERYHISGQGGGGTPSQVWMVGVPGIPSTTTTRTGWGTPPHQDWMEYPPPRSGWWGGYPGYSPPPPPPPGLDGVTPNPGLDGGGYPPPIRQSSIASTCYAVGGWVCLLCSRRRTFL